MSELKRRDISGIYIFDTLPGDEKRKPTCVEDCTQEKRREWCMSKDKDYLRNVIKIMADTFKDLCNYLVDEKCVTNKQRDRFFEMIDKAVENSKYNWALHELADQVDFVCSKVTMLADACGVTKHEDNDKD